MAMHYKNDGKTQGRACKVLLAGALALSMCPAMAIAQTQNESHDVFARRSVLVQSDEQLSGEQPQLTGERPELPTNADGTMAEPPAKPEGDQTPELPEGEQPQLTGERPELPTNADGTMAEPPAKLEGDQAPEDGQKPADANDAATESSTTPGSEGDQPTEGRERTFMDRMGDFFRRMFDWISGTGR